MLVYSGASTLEVQIPISNRGSMTIYTCIINIYFPTLFHVLAGIYLRVAGEFF